MAEALAEASKRDESLVWRAGDVNPPTGTAESSQHRHRRRGGRGGPMRDRELTRRAEKLGEAAPARSPDAMGRLARRAPVYTQYSLYRTQDSLTPPQGLHAPMAVRQGVEHQLGT